MQASKALESLYGVLGSVLGGEAPAAVAARALEVFSELLAMDRGAVVRVGPAGPRLLAVRGMSDEEALGRFLPHRREVGKVAAGEAFLLLRRKQAPLAPASLSPGANPPRREISLFCAVVPGDGDGRAVIAADGLFGEGVDPSEDLRLLTAGAFLLSSRLGGDGEAAAGRGRGATLGKVLQGHIAEWIAPMDTARRVVRSDVYDRLMGEVEKILIAAVLKKTGHVQTEAARFLGINRNTLSRKMREHGLRSK